MINRLICFFFGHLYFENFSEMIGKYGELCMLEISAPKPFWDYIGGKSIEEIQEKGKKWRAEVAEASKIKCKRCGKIK